MGETKTGTAAGGSEEGIHLLVVDDEAPVREALSRLFSGANGIARVTLVASGTDALTYTIRHHVDVALVDIRMPGMDGIETTRRLRACQPSLRVLGLTTFEVAEYGRLMAGAGASGILLKDIGADNLMRSVLLAHAGVELASCHGSTAIGQYKAYSGDTAAGSWARASARRTKNGVNQAYWNYC